MSWYALKGIKKRRSASIQTKPKLFIVTCAMSFLYHTDLPLRYAGSTMELTVIRVRGVVTAAHRVRVGLTLAYANARRFSVFLNFALVPSPTNKRITVKGYQRKGTKQANKCNKK